MKNTVKGFEKENLRYMKVQEAREATLWMRCLPHGPGDLSLDLQSSCQNSGVAV